MDQPTSTLFREGNNIQCLILAGLVYFMYIFILPKQSFESDMWCWINWSIFIRENGLGAAYSGPTNYPPLFQYVLWAFAAIQGSNEAIVSNIYVLKAFPLIFDFLGAWMVIKLINREDMRWFYFFLLVLNPILIYNTLLWGQVDAVHSFFLLIGTVAAARGNILSAGIWLFLAINFKLQSVVYVPVIGLLLLPELVKRANILKIAYTLIILGFLQALVILPFWIQGEMHNLFRVVFGAVDYYPVISANAYNMWYWIVAGDVYAIKDNLILSGITAKSWGLILFGISSLILLFPLFYKILAHWFKGKLLPDKQQYLDIALIMGALVTMNLFFFATQMHERYSHIALLFTCAYALRHSKWLIFSLFFTAYFLNMEAVYRYLDWENYRTFIYEPGFVAAIYFLYMVLMYIDLYKLYFRKE
jgi:Gpi18-like mannosyltransferase